MSHKKKEESGHTIFADPVCKRQYLILKLSFLNSQLLRQTNGSERDSLVYGLCLINFCTFFFSSSLRNHHFTASFFCARSLLPPRVVFHPDSAIDIVATARGEMASTTTAQTTNDVDVSNKTKDLSTLTSISKRKDGEVNGGVTPYVFYCLLLLMLSNLILQVRRRNFLEIRSFYVPQVLGLRLDWIISNIR